MAPSLPSDYSMVAADCVPCLSCGAGGLQDQSQNLEKITTGYETSTQTAH